MSKSLLIKATINGRGIVNFDSKDQKFLWNRQSNVENVMHDNVSFGKGRYYATDDTKENGKVLLRKEGSISADCIRHAMYEDCMSIHLPNIMHDDGCLLRTVANPVMLVRGYMFARDKKTTWRRTSSLRLSDARAITSSVPALETFSNAQPKTGKDKSEDSAETSFFKREVRGDTTYTISGGIDPSELGFISLSEIHDRLNFDPDYANSYCELLGNKLGSKVPEVGFYQKNGDIYEIPELGILLTPEQIKLLVVDTLKRLARFNIVRTVTGSAYTSEIQIKVVNDPLYDRFNSDEGWVKIFDGKK